MEQPFDHSNSASGSDTWHQRLSFDLPEQSAVTREAIVLWLLGSELEQFDSNQLEKAKLAMLYRYRILQQCYLGVGPEKAYRQLTARLSCSVLLRNKIYAWVASSRDRQRAVVHVLQEVIQELLQGDRYLQQQMSLIAECTKDARLRNALLFASIEEYCLRPIGNRPLIACRFVSYLQRHYAI